MEEIGCIIRGELHSRCDAQTAECPSKQWVSWPPGFADVQVAARCVLHALGLRLVRLSAVDVQGIHATAPHSRHEVRPSAGNTHELAIEVVARPAIEDGGIKHRLAIRTNSAVGRHEEIIERSVRTEIEVALPGSANGIGPQRPECDAHRLPKRAAAEVDVRAGSIKQERPVAGPCGREQGCAVQCSWPVAASIKQRVATHTGSVEVVEGGELWTVIRRRRQRWGGWRQRAWRRRQWAWRWRRWRWG